MTTRRIDEIVVGERHRRDLGDIDALARTTADLGLLQPIVIRPDDRLLAGHRPLAALRVRQLKRDAPEAPDNENPASAGRVGRFCRGRAS
jgi:ParB-like chromosome segregation protein Spo0J